MTITIEPTFFFVFVVAAIALLIGAAIGGSRVYKAAYQVMSETLDLYKQLVIHIEQKHLPKKD